MEFVSERLYLQSETKGCRFWENSKFDNNQGLRCKV